MTQQSINVKPSAKISVKSPVVQRDMSIVDVSKVVGISVGSPVKEITLGGRVKGYLGGETALIFIGIMVGIISLAVSLWSMHKNSVLTKRLTEINSSMVDIIVEAKKENAESPKAVTSRNAPSLTSSSYTTVPKQSPVSQAQAIRERLREKRLVNTDSRLILEEQARKAEELRAEQSRVLQRLELEAAENRKAIERSQALTLAEANKSLKELAERKNVKPTPIMETDPRKLFPEPHNPVSAILNKVIPDNLTSKLPAKTLSEFVPNSLEQTNQPMAFGQVDDRVEIDVDDLERDLMFLRG